jgi:hypothetical protein
MSVEEDLLDRPAAAGVVHEQVAGVDHLPDPAAGEILDPLAAGLQHGFLRRPITKKEQLVAVAAIGQRPLLLEKRRKRLDAEEEGLARSSIRCPVRLD